MAETPKDPDKGVPAKPAKPPVTKPVEPAKPVEPQKHKRAPSGLTFASLTPQVTKKQMERNGIASSPVRARTEDARLVREKATPPEKKTEDAKRRRAEPYKSAHLSDPKYKGYDASKGKPGKPDRSQNVRDPRHCKDRPTDNKPKGGGGSGKSFVPWRGTKFGC